MREYAALPHNYIESLDRLTDEEFGRLMRALIRYSMTGETSELPGNEFYAFGMVKVNEDRFIKSYSNLTEKRSAAGRKGAAARWGQEEAVGEKEGFESPAAEALCDLDAGIEAADETGADDGNIFTCDEAGYGNADMTENGKNGNVIIVNGKMANQIKSNQINSNLINSNLIKSNSLPAERSAGLSDADFEKFWSCYPRKAGKQNARKVFKKLRNVRIEELINAVSAQSRTRQWTDEGGRFIPYPATWLNQRRWEDEPEIQASEMSGSKYGIEDVINLFKD